MKKQMKLSTLAVATFAVLVACNNDEPSDQEESNQQSNDSEETISEVDEETNEADEPADDESDSVLASGSLEDQLDHSIGDTGAVETLIGDYEVTVNKVEILEDIDGEASELDYFILVNYTVVNIGDEEINAREAIDTMEYTGRLDGSGYSDYSEYYDQFDTVEGDLSPGEYLTGEALYDAYESEENYLRITEGLVGSGAVKNQIRFTFEKSEIE